MPYKDKWSIFCCAKTLLSLFMPRTMKGNYINYYESLGVAQIHQLAHTHQCLHVSLCIINISRLHQNPCMWLHNNIFKTIMGCACMYLGLLSHITPLSIMLYYSCMWFLSTGSGINIVKQQVDKQWKFLQPNMIQYGLLHCKIFSCMV